MPLKQFGLLIITASLGLAMPVRANPTNPLIDKILDHCSSVHVGDRIQNNVFSQSSSRIRDRFKKANVGAKVWVINAGGSGQSRSYQVDQNQYSYDRSTVTPVVGQDCSANVNAAAAIETNRLDNETIRYGIDADLYKFDRQLRRDRLDKMFRW